MSKSVVLLSGGLDSSTLLYLLTRREAKQVTALSIFYGQRHSYELAFARALAKNAGVPHVEVDLTALHAVFASSQSSQVGSRVSVPEGHYSADNMAITVVPNRNMILLSIAGALAVSKGASEVAYAAHAGDHAQYPDCRSSFIASYNETLLKATDESVALYTPFVFRSKADIVQLGAGLGVPFEKTWSCYKGEAQHCGRCSTCVERAEAFSIAGVTDPTEYQDVEFWKTVVKDWAEGKQ